ncbi:hypothetical protein ACFE04_028700 [Oxalis oulophora]
MYLCARIGENGKVKGAVAWNEICFPKKEAAAVGKQLHRYYKGSYINSCIGESENQPPDGSHAWRTLLKLRVSEIRKSEIKRNACIGDVLSSNCWNSPQFDNEEVASV